LTTVPSVIDRNTAFAVGLCDALARLGVEHACITPGSRSTPLALAFADDERFTDWSHHDERSSAFFALGIARTTGRPVVVVTTSGTAASELYPAVVEARYGRVPLIAITADRPADLRDVGAPQTIDQRDLFGRMPAWSQSLDAGDVDPTPWIGSLAGRMVTAALGPPPGPVHLNVGFREPLVPDADEGTVRFGDGRAGSRPPTGGDEVVAEYRTGTGSAGNVPAVHRSEPLVDPATAARLAASVSGRRGVVIAGPQGSSEGADAATRFAAAAGWPIIADPLSGLRAGPHDTTALVAHGDALAAAGWLDRAEPDAVIRFGAVPTSKPVWQWLADHPDTPQILIEPFGWRDPTATATLVVRSDPAAVFESLTGAMEPADDEWRASWARADAAAGQAIDRSLEDIPFPNEPAVARMLASALPDPSVLWAASSMPIRDIDTFFGTTTKDIRILGNRGANGIDGFLSAGLGSASVSGRSTVLLAGDLSILHDVGALAGASRMGVPATIVALNNDGGGIFHFLPQDGHRHFERHFGTPHGLSLTAVAGSFGVPAREVDDPDDLAKALAEDSTGPRLVEIHTDRVENVAIHRMISAAVREAIAGGQ
jgi:2-succinyl-5-enolpyruvyl-6-hydroxy-3-cyclohexene-1-carboxylate synthase